MVLIPWLAMPTAIFAPSALASGYLGVAADRPYGDSRLGAGLDFELAKENTLRLRLRTTVRQGPEAQLREGLGASLVNDQNGQVSQQDIDALDWREWRYRADAWWLPRVAGTEEEMWTRLGPGLLLWHENWPTATDALIKLADVQVDYTRETQLGPAVGLAFGAQQENAAWELGLTGCYLFPLSTGGGEDTQQDLNAYWGTDFGPRDYASSYLSFDIEARGALGPVEGRVHTGFAKEGVSAVSTWLREQEPGRATSSEQPSFALGADASIGVRWGGRAGRTNRGSNTESSQLVDSPTSLGLQLGMVESFNSKRYTAKSTEGSCEDALSLLLQELAEDQRRAPSLFSNSYFTALNGARSESVECRQNDRRGTAKLEAKVVFLHHSSEEGQVLSQVRALEIVHSLHNNFMVGGKVNVGRWWASTTRLDGSLYINSSAAMAHAPIRTEPTIEQRAPMAFFDQISDALHLDGVRLGDLRGMTKMLEDLPEFDGFVYMVEYPVNTPTGRPTVERVEFILDRAGISTSIVDTLGAARAFHVYKSGTDTVRKPIVLDLRGLP